MLVLCYTDAPTDYIKSYIWVLVLRFYIAHYFWSFLQVSFVFHYFIILCDTN